MDAFWVLHGSRDYYESGRPKPIKLTEIKSYLDMFPFENKKKFVKHMQVLDFGYAEQLIEGRDGQGTNDKHNA